MEAAGFGPWRSSPWRDYTLAIGPSAGPAGEAPLTSLVRGEEGADWRPKAGRELIERNLGVA